MKCNFDIAWIGNCKNDANENDYCNEHQDIKCKSCGVQATHTCVETMILVCGAPLCNDCEHTLCDNGCNSRGNLPKGFKEHCKIAEQVYKPWYTQ